MKRILLGFAFGAGLFGQNVGEPNDFALVGRIKTEAFEKSHVMDTMGYLTDVYGPRLTASPGFRGAADWAVKQLQSYGVQNVRLEKWGSFGRSWSLKQASLELTEPAYAALDAAPLAWSESTAGTVSGELIFAPFGAAATQDPKRLEENLNKYIAQWKGKLKGKVVLFSQASTLRPVVTTAFRALFGEGIERPCRSSHSCRQNAGRSRPERPQVPRGPRAGSRVPGRPALLDHRPTAHASATKSQPAASNS